MSDLKWVPWLQRVRLTKLDEIEILRRLIAQGIGETVSLQAIASGLTGKELEAAVRKEKLAVLEEYLQEKQNGR